MSAQQPVPGNGSTTARRKASLLSTPARRYGLLAAVLVAAAVAAVAFYNRRPVAVTVASVQQNVAVRVFGLGTVEARVLSKIGFEVGATLAELQADHGDRVKKGQVLARLALGEQEAKVAKARAALQISEVNIKRTQAAQARSRFAVSSARSFGGSPSK